jgi:NAD(P)H-hydrate epimerase
MPAIVVPFGFAEAAEMMQSHVMITRAQARAVDERAVREFGMSSLVLMENAGRQLADKLQELSCPGPVVICCGTGNNGGDGFVLARHLDLRRISVRVLVWGSPARMSADAAANFAILQKSQLPIDCFEAEHDRALLAARLAGAAWIVDGLLGTGARGEPRPPLDRMIDELNDHPATRLAIDLPSGLDCDTGIPARHTIRAQHTCTFVAGKQGFRAAEAQPYLGTVHVLDIGAPRILIDRVLSGQAS